MTINVGMTDPGTGSNTGGPASNLPVVQSSSIAPAPVKPGLYARMVRWIFMPLFMASLILNVGLYAIFSSFFSSSPSPAETYQSGNRHSTEKLAIIRVNGVIMPPMSNRVIKAVKHALEDDEVHGVLLAIDSPGGTVTDSHQIYHELKKLAEKKPIVVSMSSLAASGGYFVAMGAGPKAKIFAEPTTWTGSIGVIIPHYEVNDAAEKWGVKAAPLKTGEFKDSLSPFRAMTERDKELWNNILNQSFELFLEVIDENRETLNLEQVRTLATGQIYTSKDALRNGMIDVIGFEDDALDELKRVTNRKDAKVIKYDFHSDSLWDAILSSARAKDPAAQWSAALELAAPRAMFYFSAGLPAPLAE